MKVIAHRGASCCAPENTLAAFRRAAEMGADFIETDLQLTRDGLLVAIHDETLDRTTTGTGPVSAETLEELRKLDAGAWFWKKHASKVQHSDSAGECIPTIEEILAFGRESNVGLYLEMKMPGARGAEHALAEALQAAHYLDRTVVITFDSEALARVREIEPATVTGYLYSERRTDGVAEAIGAGARELLPRADRITRKLVEQAHGSDLEVVAWTVNTPRRMKELLALGVDGIITNFPNRLAALLSTPD